MWWTNQLGRTCCEEHTDRRLRLAIRRAPHADKHVTGKMVWRPAAADAQCEDCAVERSWGVEA